MKTVQESNDVLHIHFLYESLSTQLGPDARNIQMRPVFKAPYISAVYFEDMNKDRREQVLVEIIIIIIF